MPSPSQLLLSNIDALSLLDPIPKSLKPYLKNDVFKSANRAAFLNILHYLVSKLVSPKQLKKVCWPVCDHKDMSKFLKDVTDTLALVKTKCPSLAITTPLPTLFRALGGLKVEEFFVHLSFIALDYQLKHSGFLTLNPSINKSSPNGSLVSLFYDELLNGHLEAVLRSQKEILEISQIEMEIKKLEFENNKIKQAIKNEDDKLMNISRRYPGKVSEDLIKFKDSILEWNNEIDKQEVECNAKLEKIAKTAKAVLRFDRFGCLGNKTGSTYTIKAEDLSRQLSENTCSNTKLFNSGKMCWDAYVQLAFHSLQMICSIYNSENHYLEVKDVLSFLNQLKLEISSIFEELENAELTVLTLQPKLLKRCQKLNAAQVGSPVPSFHQVFQPPMFFLDVFPNIFSGGASSVLHVSSPVRESTFLEEVKAKFCKSKLGSSLNSTAVSTYSLKSPEKFKQEVKPCKINFNTPVRKKNTRNSQVRPQGARSILMSPSFQSTPMKSPEKTLIKTVIDRKSQKPNKGVAKGPLESPIFHCSYNLSSVNETEKDHSRNSLVDLLDSLSLEGSSDFGLDCQENISFTPCKKGLPIEKEETPIVKKKPLRRPSIDKIIERYKTFKKRYEATKLEEEPEITEEFNNVSYLD